MNTAIFVGPNTMSARRRSSFSGLRCTRYRNPAAWSIRLIATSGEVSRDRLPCMDFRLAADDAQEPSGGAQSPAEAEVRSAIPEMLLPLAATFEL